MRLIIFGGRAYADFKTAEAYIDSVLAKYEGDIEIVSGRCSDAKGGVLTFTTKEGIKVYGADGLGERYAEERGYKVAPFPAMWDLYGKHAGPIRNELMAKYGTHAIGFDKGGSGTFNMIQNLIRYNLPNRILKV